MNQYLIQPRDPLIARDGKPFSSDPGARAKSLPFPLPSTIAGAVRTLAGSVDGQFDLAARQLQIGEHSITTPQDLLEQIEIAGPLLSSAGRVLVPQPADALKLNGVTHRLRPVALHPEESTNLEHGLLPVALNPSGEQAKPDKLERYWHWTPFERWLVCGTLDPDEALGIDGPTPEFRSHVAIEPSTQTAQDGALFQTGGLEFRGQATQLSEVRQLALSVRSNAPLENLVAPLGGERRLAHWQQDSTAWPTLPAGVIESVLKHHACRIILLTPGVFKRGYLPEHVTVEGEPAGMTLAYFSSLVKGVQVTLRAVACARHQVISGWDVAYQNGSINGRPKPTRRLTPAGSVYYLMFNIDEATLESGSTPEQALRAWLHNVWLHNISDHAQDRRDGFGLAAIGAWDGTLQMLEVKS